MKKELLLTNEAAKALYESGKDLPIVDYHCHLVPAEILEDREFKSITEMWLGADHYKWRLMRAYGIDEELITGKAPDKDKFIAYAEALEMAAGSPLYVWSHMELAMYFEIEDTLSRENAAEIFERAGDYIRAHHLSPRKLIEKSKVEVIATTDDPSDSLEYHEAILAEQRAGSSLKARVVPSFRPDKALNLRASDFASYIQTLSRRVGYPIEHLSDLKKALAERLDFFVSLGCRVADVGIEAFPKKNTEKNAEKCFEKALSGHVPCEEGYRNYLFDMFLFLAGLYKEKGVTMQLHLNAKRNASSSMFRALGADVGGDCVGSSAAVEDLIAFLDEAELQGSLPNTIVYTNNPDSYVSYTTACGSFRSVHMGAAWWFSDHERGIRELLDVFGENSNIAAFYGMLTDSRSFLSYARHDYFRRIFASWVGEKVENGTFPSEQAAKKLISRVYYENSRGLFTGK